MELIIISGSKKGQPNGTHEIIIGGEVREVQANE